MFKLKHTEWYKLNLADVPLKSKQLMYKLLDVCSVSKVMVIVFFNNSQKHLYFGIFFIKSLTFFECRLVALPLMGYYIDILLLAYCKTLLFTNCFVTTYRRNDYLCKILLYIWRQHLKYCFNQYLKVVLYCTGGSSQQQTETEFSLWITVRNKITVNLLFTPKCLPPTYIAYPLYTCKGERVL